MLMRSPCFLVGLALTTAIRSCSLALNWCQSLFPYSLEHSRHMSASASEGCPQAGFDCDSKNSTTAAEVEGGDWVDEDIMDDDGLIRRFRSDIRFVIHNPQMIMPLPPDLRDKRWDSWRFVERDDWHKSRGRGVARSTPANSWMWWMDVIELWLESWAGVPRSKKI